MHGDRAMISASAEEIAEILGGRATDAIVKRIVKLGASTNEVAEALDDLDYERRSGEPRRAASGKIDEIRQILEELSLGGNTLEQEPGEADELEDLSVIGADELHGRRV